MNMKKMNKVDLSPLGEWMHSLTVMYAKEIKLMKDLSQGLPAYCDEVSEEEEENAN